MSSTNRGKERRENDFYPTPAWCVYALLREWSPGMVAPMWLEPCAGDGAIVRAVIERGWGNTFWDLIELRSQAVPALEQLQRDFLDPIEGEARIEFQAPRDFLMWDGRGAWNAEYKYDVCITNPPYKIAQKFIEHALKLSDTVVMLLRLNFLGSQERAAFHRANPSDVYVLTPRPDFTGDGGDSCEYAWFIWPGTGKQQVLDATDLRDKWLAEQAQSRRRKPVSEDVSCLPLFKGR